MGVSRSGRELSFKLGALANDFGDLPYKQVEAAARIVKNATLATMTVASGGDRKLSGVGRKGGKIGARYDITRAAGHTTAKVKATGPVHLIERETKAGVRPRNRVRRNAWGGGMFIGPLAGYRHPGTKGKHPWRIGVNASIEQADRVLQSTTAYALHKHF